MWLIFLEVQVYPTSFQHLLYYIFSYTYIVLLCLLTIMYQKNITISQKINIWPLLINEFFYISSKWIPAGCSFKERFKSEIEKIEDI
jgi:hypothetical protein